jgi:hypothetical protein
MFLKERSSGHLVEVIDFDSLFDPDSQTFEGRSQVGEDDQDNELFAKSQVVFMSNEELPGCWVTKEKQ